MRKICRQGDILLVEVSKVPENVKKTDNVLARGEITGHSHRMAGDQIQVLQGDDQLFVSGIGELIHEEHDAIPIDGNYQVIRQREYNPIENRQVQD